MYIKQVHTLCFQSQKATVLTGLRVDLTKAIVTHLVHEAVEEDRRTFTVNPELAGGRVVVVLFDVSACVRASSYTHHPEELVDICGDTGDKCEVDQYQTGTQTFDGASERNHFSRSIKNMNQ